MRGDASQGNGAVEVHAQRNGTEILVHGKANARLVSECGRCLKDVAARRSLATWPRSTRRSRAPSVRSYDDDEDADIDPDAPDREFYTGDEVVIDDLVRDYLLLELPMQPRCEEGSDCAKRGLPASTRGQQRAPAAPKVSARDVLTLVLCH